MKSLNKNILSGLAWVSVALLCSLSMAADKNTIDPSGTWKIALINSETKAKNPERTLKLKLQSGKLTGTIDGRSEINGKGKIFEWALSDTKLQGDAISFTVSHPPTVGQGPNSTTVYAGKLAGDTIKGTAETEWMGHTRKRDFEARRVKE